MTAVAPALTIGMPVHNGARFIREALESLLAQTFTDFELLVSDNASTDATGAICAEYVARDRRVRYVRQEHNIGLFPNVESVMRNGRGRYFMLVGDDDVYDPDYARRLIDILESRHDVGLAYSDFGYIREDGSPVAGGSTVFLDASSSRARNLAAHFLKRPVLPMIMGVFRTDVVRRSLPFVSFGPMLGGVDLVFMARALAQARVHSTRDVLFRYRIKDRSSSFPSDWPATWLAQRWYLCRLNARVSVEMCRAVAASDLTTASKLALCAVVFASLPLHLIVVPVLEVTRQRKRREPAEAAAA